MSVSDDEQPLLRHERCRTCLSKLGQNDLLSTNSIEMLSYLMDVEIESCDNLPMGLCDECLLNLRQAYSFKKKCEMTYSILIQERELDEQLNTIQTSVHQEYSDEVDEITPDVGNENDIWIQFQQNSLFLNERFENNSSSPPLCETMHTKVEPTDNNTDIEISNESENVQNRQINSLNVSPANLIKILENYESNEKFPTPVACGQCGKKFLKANILKEHILVHMQTKTHTCIFCEMSFEDSFDLRKHVSLIHTNQFEVIDICDSDNNDERSKSIDGCLAEEEENNIVNLKKRYNKFNVVSSNTIIID